MSSGTASRAAVRLAMSRAAARLPRPRSPICAMQARAASHLAAAPRFGLASRGAAAPAGARPPAAALPLGGHLLQRTARARATSWFSVRCMASKGDKSWSEIAAEAGQLATDLAKKVGNTVSGAVEKVAAAITPAEKEERRPRRREGGQREDVYRPDELPGFGGGLVGGLLGRAAGSLLRSAVGALGEQLRQAQEQVADVQDRAARVLQASPQLREELGGAVQVMPPVSQSSMTQSINGRSSRTVTLLLPVVGPSGRAAQAQVQYVEGGDAAADQLRVTVRLPSGRVLDLDGARVPGAGQVIDVDWKSVDDK